MTEAQNKEDWSIGYESQYSIHEYFLFEGDFEEAQIVANHVGPSLHPSGIRCAGTKLALSRYCTNEPVAGFDRVMSPDDDPFL